MTNDVRLYVGMGYGILDAFMPRFEAASCVNGDCQSQPKINICKFLRVLGNHHVPVGSKLFRLLYNLTQFLMILIDKLEV